MIIHDLRYNHTGEGGGAPGAPEEGQLQQAGSWAALAKPSSPSPWATSKAGLGAVMRPTPRALRAEQVQAVTTAGL